MAGEQTGEFVCMAVVNQTQEPTVSISNVTIKQTQELLKVALDLGSEIRAARRDTRWWW